MGILFPEVRTTSVRLIWQPPAAPNGIILGESPFPCLNPQLTDGEGPHPILGFSTSALARDKLS